MFLPYCIGSRASYLDGVCGEIHAGGIATSHYLFRRGVVEEARVTGAGVPAAADVAFEVDHLG